MSPYCWRGVILVSSRHAISLPVPQVSVSGRPQWDTESCMCELISNATVQKKNVVGLQRSLRCLFAALMHAHICAVPALEG